MPNDFRTDLETLLSQYPTVRRTNTPCYILVRVMIEALQSFETGLEQRAAYFRQPTGIENYPNEDPG